MVISVMRLIMMQVRMNIHGVMSIRSVNCSSHLDTIYQAIGVAIMELTIDSVRYDCPNIQSIPDHGILLQQDSR